jgi:hypothetical protein
VKVVSFQSCFALSQRAVNSSAVGDKTALTQDIVFSKVINSLTAKPPTTSAVQAKAFVKLCAA